MALSAVFATLLSSTASPLHFAWSLRKALLAEDYAKIGTLVDSRLLASCLDIDAPSLTPATLVGIYSSPAGERAELGPSPRSWGDFPNVSIAGMAYKGIMRAEVRLSDGTVLDLERQGPWTWRLFCAKIP